jgi:PSP1 C-terminal conserved region
LFYLVETGVTGEPGCFSCATTRTLPGGMEVVCRTKRGVERGLVRSCLGPTRCGLEVIGRILRRMSDNDRLVAARLERFRQRAVAACAEVLERRGIAATLIDAEQLLDGEHLVFHFLGDLDAARDVVLEELAAVYEQKIGFRKFAERMTEGCGPGCGTTASKCGTGGCAGCGASGGCATGRVRETHQ